MLESIKKRFVVDEGRRTDGGEDTVADGEVTTHEPTAPETNAREQPSPGVENTEAEEQPVDLGMIFDTLRNRRRRDVLRYLWNVESVTIGELAEHIAARECDKDVSQVNSKERKRVYVGLYQCHLPKLADVDAITYDQARGDIERGPQFDQFVEYLPGEETANTDIPSGPRWKQYAIRLLK